MTLTTDIKLFSGLTFEDLKLDSDNDYTTLVTGYILSVKAWIDRYTQIEYTDITTYPTYPIDLDQMIIEITSNILLKQSQRQDAPVLDNENFKILIRDETVLSEDIKTRLKPYIRKAPLRIFGIGTKTQYNTLINIDDDDDNSEA